MSDTPRTDAAEFPPVISMIASSRVTSSNFSRQIELELVAANFLAERYRLKTLEQDAQIAACRDMEYCKTCNTPLCQCGELNCDGEPTMDCLVCKLRTERDAAIAERDKTRAWLESETMNRDEFESLVAERDALHHELKEYRSIAEASGASFAVSQLETMTADRDSLRAEIQHYRDAGILVASEEPL